MFIVQRIVSIIPLATELTQRHRESPQGGLGRFHASARARGWRESYLWDIFRSYALGRTGRHVADPQGGDVGGRRPMRASCRSAVARGMESPADRVNQTAPGLPARENSALARHSAIAGSAA